MEITLEQEFEQFKALHKYAVLKAKIMKYYSDLEVNAVDIPYFLKETPEQKADKDLSYLLLFHKDKFNELYEEVWKEVAVYLP